MTETHTPDQAPSVDDTAVRLTSLLKEMRSEREMRRTERDKLNERLKVLSIEIDKAERMTKALIPRTRRSLTRAVDQ